MTGTEKMRRELTRLEQNVNARFSLYDQRLQAQEENRMLLQTELRVLKRLFNNMSACNQVRLIIQRFPIRDIFHFKKHKKHSHFGDKFFPIKGN